MMIHQLFVDFFHKLRTVPMYDGPMYDDGRLSSCAYQRQTSISIFHNFFGSSNFMNIDFLKSLQTAVVKCDARNRQGRPGHPLS